MAVSSIRIGLRRHFTKPGVHPYDEVKWERRDAKITNFKDGSIAFEQKGVEMPVGWSLNATNIVSQKYFSGTPGTNDRESSLKQLIDRVVDTVTSHGQKEGYFADDDEAETFAHELKHILVKQKAAFNSPVWFNIGAMERSQQASACFILAVDDTMPSILNWYREEGMIFKGGSGSGINVSTIRSSYETLSKSAGTASGPLSFMRGADASAGAIKSGGKTRRAAKMVILNVDHPDIEEFIWCKAREERKARVLEEAGFDMDLDGKDSHSIQYQNANNSVRVTDEFMQAVQEDKEWDLKAVTDGRTVRTVRARDLMRQFSEAAWECADPGMQFDTTINRWHTAPAVGRINASNPCSEYMHLDNSACNLASINLLKFLNEDGSYDIEGFKQTVEIVFTAQEILVGYSSYPTEKITENAKAFRELGLGYANLGALLMAWGLPYDSEEGRARAAAITALMNGHAYATSARLSRRVGPFTSYDANREAMLHVLDMHRAEASKINPALVPEDLLSAAHTAWDDATESAREFGVRNSQATVLAPTGTIGFMMDCDTTGIEPDLGLVKVKKLVGGGNMSIVNHTVPRALKMLGYNGQQVKDIVAYIDENKSIIGAPHIRAEHLPVFACAMGDNVIHYTGHVKMMAAVQPFISGAISKTVNMPEEVTVEDIEQLHIDAWKMGLKAIAIYRDNCKVGQPTSVSKKAVKIDDQAPVAQVAVEAVSASEASEAIEENSISAPTPISKDEAKGFVVKGPMRQSLPKKRNGHTFEFHVSDCKGFFTVGEYEDGRPGELFIVVAKQGSTLSGIMDSFAISISHGLQYGVPLKSYVKTYINRSFTPAGITDDPNIPIASSLVDYIFRRLALEYLSQGDLLELGLSAELANKIRGTQTSLLKEEVQPTDATQPVKAEAATKADSSAEPELAVAANAPKADVPKLASTSQSTQDAPFCYNCGNTTQRAGSCYVCTACGTTSGCS
jgi:ribonucleoside-diphosphate reductase alpha chain